MKREAYKKLQVVVVFFIASIVAIAIVRDSYLLAAAGVLTGVILMIIARSTAEIKTDERELTIQEKATRMTYAIFAPTIAVASFFLLLPTKSDLTIFSKGEWLYIESLGMVFAYLTLFMITLYAISYHFFSRRFGSGSHEK